MSTDVQKPSASCPSPEEAAYLVYVILPLKRLAVVLELRVRVFVHCRKVIRIEWSAYRLCWVIKSSFVQRGVKSAGKKLRHAVSRSLEGDDEPFVWIFGSFMERWLHSLHGRKGWFSNSAKQARSVIIQWPLDDRRATLPEFEQQFRE
jgi:hypothetical protein